ncbi:HD domain-containing protein, partial [Halomonas sp.]|uniref:HD domain-containing protein n=1 Tax=Halomonas sp. TaxID=1486246 RepID=UPI002991C03E|nr:hypothetical protein [Halomonas sp.]
GDIRYIAMHVSGLEAFQGAVSRIQVLELGFVAGLLHDIGKTFTYDSQGKPTNAWSLCEHDALTLEACAIALAYLDRHEPELAITLRHVWTCASPGARYGVRPATTLAKYVRDADGQSVFSNKQARIFRSSKYGMKKYGKETFWIPKTQSLNKITMIGDQKK